MSQRTQILPGEAAGVAQAAALLRAGGLVAFPTETVYGLGANALDGRAVAGVYAAKGRPSFNPLILHVPGLDAAQKIGAFGPLAQALARTFWPGPLTLVVPVLPQAGVSQLALAGLDSVALRAPAHPLAQSLLAQSGVPLAAPSANPSGKISPTTAAHVEEGLTGKIAGVLDGGACPVGVESTILDCTGQAPVLLRPGGLAVEDIEAALGQKVLIAQDPSTPKAPGQLTSHYAPGAPVRLNASSAAPGGVFLGFGPSDDHTLSAAGDLTEAAANLFAKLRALDALNPAEIAVAPIPKTGLGLAINDRLTRAAAPRTPPQETGA